MKKIFLLISMLVVYLNGVTQVYDPAKAIEYANIWWNGRNTPLYQNYDDLGGDCAAFVSQCLIAGGIDLSEGTNGNGAYVKPDGVIAGVEELIYHLKTYQDVEYLENSNGAYDQEPPFVVPGDPFFYGFDDLNLFQHSMFCVKDKLYNANSSDYYQKHKSFWAPYKYNYYFHIKNSIPEHCRNCVKDADEISIDCGGSCPPCDDAPQNNIISNSNDIKDNNYATQNINVQNAVVFAGRNVQFLSVDDITFGNGFEVQANAQIEAKTTNNILKTTRDKSLECDIMWTNYFDLNQPYFLNLVGFTSFDIRVSQPIGNNLTIIYQKNNQNINKNGSITLWNAQTGVNHNALNPKDYGQFIVDITLRKASGQANTYFSFRAVDGITLNDGFEVPMGSTVYINTSECIQYENGY